MKQQLTKRDSWASQWGFVLACIGSAVGMGNIWLFPARISQYGGAAFLDSLFDFRRNYRFYRCNWGNVFWPCHTLGTYPCFWRGN